jgi:regulation of enolase protein 1 (concanavalin A-like superfamily)
MPICRRFDVIRVSWLLALIALCGASRAFAAVPSPWAAGDIGTPALAGSASASSGTFTVTASGVDIWNASDQFHFVYQQLSGDFEVSTRVESIANTSAWAKAGVMIRTSLSANSAEVFAGVTPAPGVTFQQRNAAGATTVSAGFTAGIGAPRWVRLVRAGTTITASMSTDGIQWTAINTVSVSMASSVYAGLAVTSHNAGVTTTATLSNVALKAAAAAGGVPSPQKAADIGTPAIQGSATYVGGQYTVNAGGLDIWGTSDQFHYVYQPLSGDGEIIARVAGLGASAAWAKAGVMVRETLAANSRHADALLTSANGYSFQRRIDPSGVTVSTTGSSGVAPGWVRLVRTGFKFDAYRSTDGKTWTLLGSDTVPMADPVYVGLAVVSHNATVGTTALIDTLTIKSAATDTNQPPTVALTAPTAASTFTAPATIAMSATASDPENRLSHVDFFAGTTLISSSTTAPFAATWPAVPAGTYSLTAVASDADGGKTTSAAVTVTVQAATTNKPPTVTLTSPASGSTATAPASLTLSATASDPEGRLARVDFYNGTALLQSDTTAPYSFSWSSVPAGTYAVKAVAYDADGGSASSPVATITVSPAASSGIWVPNLATPWQWQLTGTIDQSVNVPMYDIDLFDTSATVVASLHAKGRRAVCYMSAGTWENWRPDAAAFPAAVLGGGNGWPGEKWLDIRRIDVLGPIMEARMDLCKQKGFDALEPDNIDGYSNNSGFALTAQDQLTYNKWLAAQAHARGLSIGLKNDLDQVSQLVTSFDWAINEQCFEYNECNLLAPFTQAGKAVFEVEYSLTPAQFCDKAVALKFNALKKGLDLDAAVTACPSPIQ